MVTPVTFIKNANVVVRNKIADGAGATTIHIPLPTPNQTTAIKVVKNGQTATVEVTIDTKKRNTTFNTTGFGAPITDLEDADILWEVVSSGTTNYFAGGSTGISGIRITSTPVGADVEYSIAQR